MLGRQEVSAHAGETAEAAAAAGDVRMPGAARSSEREENLELVGLVSSGPHQHCGVVCDLCGVGLPGAYFKWFSCC